MRPPYPGLDEESWTLLAPGVDVGERDRAVASQMVAEATGLHTERHRDVDHPWCESCHQRFHREAYPRASIAASRQQLDTLLGGQPLAQDVRTAVSDIWETSGGFDAADRDAVALSTGTPAEIVQAAASVLEAIDDHKSLEQDAASETRSRAARHLLIHRRPPVDAWTPADRDDLALEYLTRGELRELPTPEPLVDGVLYRHSYVVLRGRDQTFKSFVALDWAACLATGKPWLGRTVQRSRVLYVAGEGAHGLAGRLDAWEYACQEKITDEDLTVRRSALNLYRGGPALEELVRRITDGRYGLVVLDTLRRVSGGADANSSDMGIVVDNIDRLRRATANGSVLVVAHTDKGDNDARGFSGIEDDADQVWSAKRDENVLTLTNVKTKDAPDGQVIALHTRPMLDSLVLEHHSVHDEIASSRTLTANDHRLDSALRDTFGPAGASKTELMEATGMAGSSFHASRARLEKAGLWVSSQVAGRTRYRPVERPDTSSPVQPTEAP